MSYYPEPLVIAELLSGRSRLLLLGLGEELLL
jgi:hypothetical protein